MRIALLIATTGRPEVVSKTLDAWRVQTRPLDRVVLSIVEGEPAGPGAKDDVVVVQGPKGLCRQRNRGLEALKGQADVVIAADDDFVPSRAFVEGVERLFSERPEVAIATGKILADGIGGPGLSFSDAEKILTARDGVIRGSAFKVRPTLGAYGCNMVIHTSLTEPLRFDERLPLYGWQEDVDFSRRCRSVGSVVWTDVFAGVHLGVKSGRTSGVKLGYSQVVNPLYLAAKGSMPVSYAWRLVVKNVIANVVRSVWPEPYVDRVGRLRGNRLAFSDVLNGRLDPERILEVQETARVVWKGSADVGTRASGPRPDGGHADLSGGI